MNFYDHPAFEGIDKNFLDSLNQTMTMLSKTKDSTQVMAAFMAISNEAKKYNVQMTPERQTALAQHLRNHLPRDKRPQFDMLIQMMSSNR